MPISKQGWETHIVRIRQEKREGQRAPRTISAYQVFHNGKAIEGRSGNFVERQGPGDNSYAGKREHRRIAAGRYQLSTHSGEKDKKRNIVKYKTIGYAKASGISDCLGRPFVFLVRNRARAFLFIREPDTFGVLDVLIRGEI
jgi:hypothetical protein